MSKLLAEIKKLEWADIKSVSMLVLSALPGFIFRLCNKKKIWLIVERPNNAEDNGWIFFQWLKKNHPDEPFYFVLNKEAKQFDPDDRHMIAKGSFRHYVYYQASNTFIKTNFMPVRPTQRVCSYYEKYVKRNFVTAYLRHGITASSIEHHLYSVQQVDLFVCGAKPEYDYICQHAGYPEGYVQYTGLARFDDLLENQSDGRFILIMPTWRRYITELSHTAEENEKLFLSSAYYHHFKSLLTNTAFIDYVESIGHEVKFCIHAEFRRFSHLFKDIDPRVKIVKTGESIHELLMAASLLITDYSSVLFDVAYMKKPMIFYQFDLEEYHQKHFNEGYFSYEHDGMGPIVKTEQELVETVKGYYDGHAFVNNEFYLDRCEKFFPTHDNHNCERIYQAIKRIER